MSEDILNKVPNPPFPVEIMDKAPVEVENPYSGEKVMLEPIAVAVYDCIKGAEMMQDYKFCLLYTSPSPRDKRQSRMPSSA